MHRRTRRGFGGLRKLPSGRWQAYYAGPDLARHIAPTTFSAKADAEAWLAAERRLIERDEWRPPATRKSPSKGVTLREFAPGAIDRRRVRGEPLRPRTRALYLRQLDRLILPTLGDMPLAKLTADDVQRWHDALDPSKPTQRAHAYSLLRALLGQAVDEKVVRENVAHIRGAGVTRRARGPAVPSPQEVAAMADAIRPPLRLFVLLGAFGGLRYGELAELRREDVDLAKGTIRVDRAVVRVDGADLVGPPKSAAGRRIIALPPHLTPEVEAHLAAYVGRRADSLLFAREGNVHLSHTETSKAFAVAREAAGRPDVRVHDLRHAGATWAAQAGATLGELMARIGHSTPAAALRYQHAAQGRDAEIARKLSELALHIEA